MSCLKLKPLMALHKRWFVVTSCLIPTSSHFTSCPPYWVSFSILTLRARASLKLSNDYPCPKTCKQTLIYKFANCRSQCRPLYPSHGLTGNQKKQGKNKPHGWEKEREKIPHSTRSLLFPVEIYPKRSKLENHLESLSCWTTLSLSFGSKKARTSHTTPWKSLDGFLRFQKGKQNANPLSTLYPCGICSVQPCFCF